MHICGNVYGPSGVVPATTNFIFRRREEDSEVAKEYSFGNSLQSAFLVKGVPFGSLPLHSTQQLVEEGNRGAKEGIPPPHLMQVYL